MAAPARDGWVFQFVTYQDAAGEVMEKAVFRQGTTEKLVQDWRGLSDCAHFLSRCLSAGGITGASSVYVPELVRILQLRADTRTLAEKVNRSQGQNIVDSGILKPGDMIGYFNISSQGNFGGARRYSHSTMYVGKLGVKGSLPTGRVACHSVSRFSGLTSRLVSDEWHLDDPHYTYTFIHFSEDDNESALLIKAVPQFSGWWEVSVPRASPVFQFNRPTGSAVFTTRRPTSARTVPLGQRAYWFATSLTPPVSVSFTWRTDGTVDIWTPGATAREFNVITNGTTTRTATRMF